MANWSGFTLTNQGQALQAKINAGKTTLRITRLGLGSGTASNVMTLTGLVKQEQSISIGSIETENNKVIIKTTLNNKNVSRAYEQREMGLFATDPNVGEVLFAYMIDNNPDTMPAYNSSTVVAEALTLNLLFSNTGNISATLDTSLYATLKDLDDHNKNLQAHENIIMTAAKDSDAKDDSDKIASTSWVNKAMSKFKKFTSSQISDFESSVKNLFSTDEFYDKVIIALRERTLSGLGVKYNFNNPNAWSISMGVLFGGLIIQGRTDDFNKQFYIDSPLPINAKVICALAVDAVGNITDNDTVGQVIKYNIGGTTNSKIRFLTNYQTTSLFAWIAICTAD